VTEASPTFRLSDKQAELNRLLASPARHILAWGGSRIWHDTLPKVMATCFPDVTTKQDKAAWF
jgi:hypothetical protein